MISITKLCKEFFGASLKSFNQARVSTLFTAVEGLIKGDQLSLTSIGRHLSGKVAVKHKIKRVDRLLGNNKLQADTQSIYAHVSQRLLDTLPEYVIAIDWSGCCRRDYHLLRASLLYEGRSIPLLNKVVEEQHQETTAVHHQFLDELADCLPRGKDVYIITDGGFKTPWFKKVEELGWYFIGRLRGRVHVYLDEEQQWQPNQTVAQQATNKPRELGMGLISKTSSTQCRAAFHLVKEKNKGRHKKRGRKQAMYPDTEKQYRSVANEPWLLVTNAQELSSLQVISLYRRRMQIEQNFRDDKSQRYGFGWRNSFTEGEGRISILCLISALATMLLWLLGFDAENKQLARQFQANTIRHRRVLSFLTLSKSLLKQEGYQPSLKALEQALLELKKRYHHVLFV